MIGHLLACAPALAQSDAQSASARASANEVRLGDAIEPEHFAGDWNGTRTRLKNAGVDLQIGYLAEVADVASGGLHRGADYAHQIKLQADIDGRPLLGIDALTFHAALINREGRNASADRLGDDLFQVQEIYGSTGRALLHLSYGYAEYRAANGLLDVKIGRLAVGQDFADSPLYCEYLSLGLCPSPRALSLGPAFTVLPSATWASRARVASRDLYLSLGIYEARPREGGRSGFDWGWSYTTGVLAPAEIGWEPRFAGVGLQGHYKAGVAYDSSRYARVDQPLSTRRGQLSWWLLADQMLVRTGSKGTDGVMVLTGWTHSSPQTSVLTDFGFAGVSARGAIPGRSGDVVNVLYGHGAVSGRLTAAQRAAATAGEPLPTGFSALPGSLGAAVTAPGVQTSEDFLEANYGIKLKTGFTVVPDLQYVWRPGATRAVPNALVVSARVEVNF